MDQRPERARPHISEPSGPTLLVLSAEPVAEAGALWLDSVLPKTTAIYRDAALLWRSAKVIFDAGKIVSRTSPECALPESGELRALVEAAYAQRRPPGWTHLALGFARWIRTGGPTGLGAFRGECAKGEVQRNARARSRDREHDRKSERRMDRFRAGDACFGASSGRRRTMERGHHRWKGEGGHGELFGRSGFEFC